MLEIDMTSPRIERLLSEDAPLDLIVRDPWFGESALWTGPLFAVRENGVVGGGPA